MDKIKTLTKRKRYSRNIPKMQLKHDTPFVVYSPTEELLDESFISQAIWECLKNNDPEGVMDIIHTHLEIVNKVKASQENDLPRSSMYNAMKGKNPTIKTLAKLINCFS